MVNARWEERGSWRTTSRNDDVLLDFGKERSSAILSEAWRMVLLRFWCTEQTRENIKWRG